MSTYKVMTPSGKRDYVAAANKAQAMVAAAEIFPDEHEFIVIPATQSEIDVLMRAHSLPIKGE